jgi:hypothetical protein
MGARIVAGRAFSRFDGTNAPGVVIVNETFARRYLEEGAVGCTVRTWTSGIGPLGVNLKAGRAHAPEGFPFEVVGVVADVRNAPLGQPVEPALYFSALQFPFSEQFIAVRATAEPAALAAVRDAMRTVTPGVPSGSPGCWPRSGCTACSPGRWRSARASWPSA